MQTTHPTRTLPLCSTCKHTTEPYKTASGQRLGGDWCNHPSVPVSIINGRSHVTCSLMRQPGLGQCGLIGTLYEPRPALTADAEPQHVLVSGSGA